MDTQDGTSVLPRLVHESGGCETLEALVANKGSAQDMLCCSRVCSRYVVSLLDMVLWNFVEEVCLQSILAFAILFVEEASWRAT
jgi:hypothetical protein